MPAQNTGARNEEEAGSEEMLSRLVALSSLSLGLGWVEECFDLDVLCLIA
jgi:hypothetical protein